MQTQNNGTKTIIGMMIGSIVMTAVGLLVGKVIEPKLQIQRGTIIDYELQENTILSKNIDLGNTVGAADMKSPYITIYTVQDDETGETSQIWADDIMFPYNMLMGFLPIKHVVYSTYRNVALYNIMIGWKAVGILGILFSILFLVKNPNKNE